ELYRLWDSRAFRIVDAGSEDGLARYPYGFVEGCSLELLFHPGSAGAQELAQLGVSAFSWLFESENSRLPVGMGLWDVPDLAEQHAVRLPASVGGDVKR